MKSHLYKTLDHKNQSLNKKDMARRINTIQKINWQINQIWQLIKQFYSKLINFDARLIVHNCKTYSEYTIHNDLLTESD